MNINPIVKKGLLALPFIALISVYQNCGQSGSISMLSAENPFVSPAGVSAEYEEVSLNNPSYPDLKIFLILDNSDSMRANQIRLKESIARMFDANSESLAQFNSQTFIITTSQLNVLQKISGTAESIVYNNPTRSLVIGEMGSMKDPAQFTNAIDLSFLYSQRNDPLNAGVTGLAAGDILGFKAFIDSSSAEKVVTKYVAAPVFDFETVPTATTPSRTIASVEYKAGTNVQDYIQRIGQRIDVINPEKISLTSAANNESMQAVIEDESGFCGMARVLKAQQEFNNFYQPGDIASFIIATDEKESDPTGSRCVYADSKYKDYYFEGQCVQPNSFVEYTMKEKQTTLNIKRPRRVAVAWDQRFSLSRSERKASCQGSGLVSSYAYSINIPQYKVQYTRENYNVFEGGGKKLSSVQNNLVTGTISGNMPPSCLSESALLSRLGLSNSASKEYRLKNISCIETSYVLNGNGNFSNYKFLSHGSPCSPSDQASIFNLFAAGKADASLASCLIQQNNVSINFNPASNLFPDTSTGTNACSDAVNAHCAGQLQSCQVKSYVTYIAPIFLQNTTSGPSDTRSISTFFDCNQVTCGNAFGLCGNSAPANLLLSDYASQNGLSCTRRHIATSFVDQSEPNTTVVTKTTSPDVTIDCNSSCDLHPEFCPNVSGFVSSGKTISQYNLSQCQAPAIDYEKFSYPLRTLKDIPNPNRLLLSCDSTCSGSQLCSGNLSNTPVHQYLKSLHNNNQLQSCDVKFKPGLVKTAAHKEKDKVSCEVGYELDASSIALKSPFRTDPVLVDQDYTAGPRQGIKQFITSRINQDFGNGRFSMATFVTKPADATARFTSGADYEQLMDDLGQEPHLKRSVSSPADYSVALEYLSQKIAAQLKKSVSLKSMKPNQKIRRVWMASDVEFWKVMSADQFEVAGRTFTINDQTLLNRMMKEKNVKFKVEMY